MIVLFFFLFLFFFFIIFFLTKRECEKENAENAVASQQLHLVLDFLRIPFCRCHFMLLSGFSVAFRDVGDMFG